MTAEPDSPRCSDDMLPAAASRLEAREPAQVACSACGGESLPSRPDLAACVTESMRYYFQDLEGETPTRVYEMVLRCVERPLFEFILAQAGGKQIVAAQMLGMNRNTLRKKLDEHGLL